MADTADPDAVEQAAQNWSDAMVQCRIFGHNWRALTVTHAMGSYTIRQRCSRRCGCERESVMNERGYLHGGWKLTYAEGYLLERGTGRVDGDGRARLRIVALRSMNVVEGES
jgi:hypothetical protein